MRAKVSYYGGAAKDCVLITGSRLAVIGQGQKMFDRGWNVNYHGFHIALGDMSSETQTNGERSHLWLRKKD